MADARAAKAGRIAVFLMALVASIPALAEDAPDEMAGSELDTLVAPIALFPDPLLAAVLQASVVPLDVIKASRFLDEYAKDSTVTPDADWDPAVLGLLAFPTVLQGMNEHLDWVQSMGDAVEQRLPDVQDSIQQVRSEFYAGGVLKSDDKQTVEVDSEIIRISPTDPNQIYVPDYDPQTLIAAVEANHAAASSAGPSTESGPPPTPAAEPGPTPTEAVAPPEPASAAEVPAEETSTAAAPAEPAAPPPAAESAPAAVAPATYAAPITYAAPVAYPAATTSSSLWPALGGFAGGALVGGILGYAIGDDNDDNDHDHYDGWHSDLNGDDLEDVVDRIDDDRDDARRDRQDYATSSREDRQEFKNQDREDRQQAQTDAAAKRQDQKKQRDDVRRAHTESAQAQLKSRAQTPRGDGAAAKRKTPSPTAIQAVPTQRAKNAQRPTPQFSQAGKAVPASAARAPARQSGAAATHRTPARAGDGRPAGNRNSALSGIERGSTVKRQEVRGAQSRQAAARPAKPERHASTSRAERPKAAKARSAPHQASKHASRPASSKGHALGGGGGGGAKKQAARGKQSRNR